MKKVLILMGSGGDLPYSEEIAAALEDLGIEYDMRVASAHKTPELALEIIRSADKAYSLIVTVAGLSNALSGFAAANTLLPVIAAPPLSRNFAGMDILSSLSMPRGVSPMTVLGASQAALASAKIIALTYPEVYESLKNARKTAIERIDNADKKLRDGQRKES